MSIVHSANTRCGRVVTASDPESTGQALVGEFDSSALCCAPVKRLSFP
jgi:hypothetical protein